MPLTSAAEKLLPRASAKLGTSLRVAPVVFSVVERVPYSRPTHPSGPNTTMSLRSSPGADVVTPAPSVVNPEAVSAATAPSAGFPNSRQVRTPLVATLEAAVITSGNAAGITCDISSVGSLPVETTTTTPALYKD